MATAFTRKGSASEPMGTADVDKLHSKIGQLVVERDFLADASHQLLGTRPSRDIDICQCTAGQWDKKW